MEAVMKIWNVTIDLQPLTIFIWILIYSAIYSELTFLCVHSTEKKTYVCIASYTSTLSSYTFTLPIQVPIGYWMLDIPAIYS